MALNAKELACLLDGLLALLALRLKREWQKSCTFCFNRFLLNLERETTVGISDVPRGLGGFELSPPQIPKVFQNSTKLNLVVKTVKNC